MTKKFHILLVILTLGFFATPTLTYACGTKSTKTEKSCCKKGDKACEKDSTKCDKAEKKECCKKDKDSTATDHH